MDSIRLALAIAASKQWEAHHIDVKYTFLNGDISEDIYSPTIPKWVAKTIHAAGELAGNPSDTRRTRSQFESALCMKDPLFAMKCYLMVDSDP